MRWNYEQTITLGGCDHAVYDSAYTRRITAFVAQKRGMDTMPPIAFNGIRTLIGGIALLPVIYIMGRDREEKREGTSS